ncbi:MAG: SOS response-associated peptidase [Planctomycetota bacterium]
MCGRFTILYTWEQVWTFHQPFRGPDAQPAARYNVAPTTGVPALRLADDREPEAVYLTWWLTPHWAKSSEHRYSMFNARSEGVETKPAFRGPFRKSRCVLPISGFYEWQAPAEGSDRRKQPYYIRRADGEPILLAGLWDRWEPDPTQQAEGLRPIESCTVLTTGANTQLADLHDRMPCMLEPEQLERWLDPTLTQPESFHTFLRPAPEGVLAMHPVSVRVGNARLDEPSLIQPTDSVAPSNDPEPPPEGSLFA